MWDAAPSVGAEPSLMSHLYTAHAPGGTASPTGTVSLAVTGMLG